MHQEMCHWLPEVSWPAQYKTTCTWCGVCRPAYTPYIQHTTWPPGWNQHFSYEDTSLMFYYTWLKRSVQQQSTILTQYLNPIHLNNLGLRMIFKIIYFIFILSSICINWQEIYLMSFFQQTKIQVNDSSFLSWSQDPPQGLLWAASVWAIKMISDSAA